MIHPPAVVKILMMMMKMEILYLIGGNGPGQLEPRLNELEGCHHHS